MNFKLTILFILLTQIGFAQKQNIELVAENPRYESIVDVIMGPRQWLDNSDSDYEAGFQYRIVVTRMEIYETLFIEKLIIDIEGSITKIKWAKMPKMIELMDKLNISSEQQNFSDIKWTDDQTFSALIYTTPITVRISDDNTFLVVNKNTN